MRLEMMPSRPILQAWRKTTSPSDDHIRVAAHDFPGQISITLVMPLGGIAFDDQIFSFNIIQAA
jgi:hypothetical protein